MFDHATIEELTAMREERRQRRLFLNLESIQTKLSYDDEVRKKSLHAEISILDKMIAAKKKEAANAS